MPKKPAKPKRGRPPLKDGSRKEVIVRLLVSPALRSQLEEVAASEGVGMSEFIRKLIEVRLDRAAKSK